MIDFYREIYSFIHIIYRTWTSSGKRERDGKHFLCRGEVFSKTPVIERIVLFKLHLVLLIIRKQQELTHEFQVFIFVFFVD